MKFIDEYRDPVLAREILAEIKKAVTRHWVIMEVCGGHTHAIVKNGIDQILPPQIELVHGPGCPVCVTPVELIDKAVAISQNPGVIFTSFGDMLRVPGSTSDLFMAKSAGADIRIVYSPLESLNLARENPDKEVVFFAVGFETTAPGNAMAIVQAEKEGLRNFTELASHVLVPPAITALLDSSENRVQGYLAAGHVCTVMGWRQYEAIAEKYRVPIVPTGFEPVDILSAILMVVRQLEEGRHAIENAYGRSVTREGNKSAQMIIDQVFEVSDRKWRGIGMLPASGLRIRQKFSSFDAEKKFHVDDIEVQESSQCISGQILQGLKKPFECEAFGRDCSPERPLGATMVSGEGACSAYYKYHRTS